MDSLLRWRSQRHTAEISDHKNGDPSGCVAGGEFCVRVFKAGMMGGDTDE